MHRQMPSIQRIWSGPGWFGTRRSMVQIHSPRPLLLANLQQRKVPTTSWLCAKRSVVPMSSPNDLHFPLQIGVKWRDAATTFSSFCSPGSPNRTGFGMGRLKPRPTFSATNEVVEHLRDGRMQVDITASCRSLENVGDSAPVLFSLLANVERLTVVGDVLLDTKRQQFRDAGAASRKKRGAHLIPACRIRYKLYHLFHPSVWDGAASSCPPSASQ